MIEGEKVGGERVRVLSEEFLEHVGGEGVPGNRVFVMG